MDDSVNAYRIRRQQRLDRREFKESDVLRDKDGKFASKGVQKCLNRFRKS